VRLLVALVGCSLWAGQYGTVSSLTTLSASTGMGNDNSGSVRFEARVSNFAYVSQNNYPMGFISANAPYCERHSSTGLICRSAADTAADSASVSLSLAGRGDFYFRFQRDVSGMRLTLEIWDADGTDYASTTKTLTAIGTSASRATFGINGDSVSGDIHWLKYFTTVVDLGTPPVGTGTGNGGNWEFEGNTNDSSGLGRNFSVSGTAVAYGTSEVFDPYCDAGAFQVFRAGASATLDGSDSYPLDEGGTLTYLWQLTSGASSVNWTSSKRIASPTFKGTIFGQYTFRLAVTDSSGNTSPCEITHGSVATDSLSNVVVSNSVHRQILGPMMAWGATPWDFFDTEYMSWADLMASTQGAGCSEGTVCAIDEWNTALTGTISLTNGSTTVTGSGTSFQADLCGGDTTPDDNYLVVWYQADGRRYVSSYTCTSATQITLGSNWTGTNLSNVSYSKWTNAQVARWINGSSNVNYYDAVMAYYALYYRTGLTKYLTAARWLADRWWTIPTIDKGRAFDIDGSGNSGGVGQPRLQALSGLWMRAYDDPPEEMFTGFEKLHDGSLGDAYLVYQLDTLKSRMVGDDLLDFREASYTLMHGSLCALFSPVEADRDTCKALVATSVKDLWYPQRSADGLNRAYADTYGSIMDSRYNGKVTMTNGSANVLLNVATSLTASPTWTSDQINGKRFITTPDVRTPDAADQQYYTITYVDANTGTLDRPYTGTSGAKHWAVAASDGWIGYGLQPFMVGINAKAMHFASLAMDGYDTTAKTYAEGMRDAGASWLRTEGKYASNKGLAYGVGFAGVCAQPSPCMSDGSTDYTTDRQLQSEIHAALAYSYLATSSADTLAFGDQMFSGSWARYSTDTGYDGTYLDLSFSYGIRKFKDFGFQWGFGGGNNWPSARIGGVAAESLVTRSIRFRVADVPNTDHVEIIVTKPDGSTATTNCGTTSPCDVQMDSRQAKANLSIRYVLTNGHSRTGTIHGIQ
jgi:hypothetical protein